MQFPSCYLVEYWLRYNVQQPAIRFSFCPTRMVPPIGDWSLATRSVDEIHNEETSPRGFMSEASVSMHQRPVEDRLVFLSGLPFTPCPPS